MFEERRNLIGRPPINAKSNNGRPMMVQNKGWDRQQRLAPLPNQMNSRVRGVSLERKKPLTDGESLRRSKSQYQVDEASGLENPNQAVPQKPQYSNTPNLLKLKGSSPFVDGNQNRVAPFTNSLSNASKRTPHFGHNPPLLAPFNPSHSSLRQQGVASPYR